MFACALFSDVYLVFTTAWKVYLSLVPKQVAREISGWKLAREIFARPRRIAPRENAAESYGESSTITSAANERKGKFVGTTSGQV